MKKTKIMLLGDSIRLGYQAKVIELLGDEYEVYCPEDNCRYARYTMFCLPDFLGGCPDPDLIHWNNGIWDTTYRFEHGVPFTAPLRYIEDLEILADQLKKVTPNVIFATSTPVKPANENQGTETIRHFNALAVAAMKEKGVEIDDLFSVVEPNIESYICDDLLHLTEEGKQACAEAVVASIKKKLGR